MWFWCLNIAMIHFSMLAKKVTDGSLLDREPRAGEPAMLKAWEGTGGWGWSLIYLCMYVIGSEILFQTQNCPSNIFLFLIFSRKKGACLCGKEVFTLSFWVRDWALLEITSHYSQRYFASFLGTLTAVKMTCQINHYRADVHTLSW